MILLPRFTRSLLARSLLAWAFVRVLATAAGSAGVAPPPNPLQLVPWAAVLVVATVGVAGWVSARRRNEELFLLSLGYGRVRLLATIVALPALLELVIAVAVRG